MRSAPPLAAGMAVGELVLWGFGVSTAPEPVIPSSDNRIEITLPSGHCLTLSGAFDKDMVVLLVRGLSA